MVDSNSLKFSTSEDATENILHVADILPIL